MNAKGKNAYHVHMSQPHSCQGWGIFITGDMDHRNSINDGQEEGGREDERRGQDDIKGMFVIWLGFLSYRMQQYFDDEVKCIYFVLEIFIIACIHFCLSNIQILHNWRFLIRHPRVCSIHEFIWCLLSK